MAEKPYKVIDLFAGAGGMSLGFHQAGFKTLVAVEIIKPFAETFRLNFDAKVIDRPIQDAIADGELDLTADVVIGGPPCQGFSNLNGNRPTDPRRQLWRYYMDVVERSRCSVFVMENVPNLITSPEGQEIIDTAKRLGFHVTAKKLLASRFGVPQNRWRAFIVGSRFEPLELSDTNGKRTTVKQAFKGIPAKPHYNMPNGEPVGGMQLHFGRNPTPMSVKRYKIIPPGGNRFDLQRLAPELTPGCWIRKQSGGTDLFGRLEWDKPARCTIRTEFYKPEKGRYLHPVEHRPITHWEAARLQTFPDDFKFCGTKIKVAIQIGNAVPPVLAQAVAEQIREHLRKHRKAVKARQLEFAF